MQIFHFRKFERRGGQFVVSVHCSELQLIRAPQYVTPVSYTHLDVYKRQTASVRVCVHWNFKKQLSELINPLAVFAVRQLYNKRA